jgi:hypothetical protein
MPEEPTQDPQDRGFGSKAARDQERGRALFRTLPCVPSR